MRAHVVSAVSTRWWSQLSARYASVLTINAPAIFAPRQAAKYGQSWCHATKCLAEKHNKGNRIFPCLVAQRQRDHDPGWSPRVGLSILLFAIQVIFGWWRRCRRSGFIKLPTLAGLHFDTLLEKCIKWSTLISRFQLTSDKDYRRPNLCWHQQ